MMGRKVDKIYSRLQRPMGTVVLIPTVVLILNSESASPSKNRNRETWRQPGTASATIGIYHPSHPSYKYCRSRALFRGSLYRLKTCMYSRTHFWKVLDFGSTCMMDVKDGICRWWPRL